MPPAAFFHPQNAPKLLGPTSNGRVKGWEEKGRGGKKRKWKRRTLDPHNVGNRLMPLVRVV